jgi:hypothetical protein
MRVVLPFALLALAACSVAPAPAAKEEPEGALNFGSNSPELRSTIGRAACQKMDIVFVIDDSSSMQEEQANLIANFPKFISEIDAFEADGAALDYHVAVTTTSRDLKIDPSPGDQGWDQHGINGLFLHDPTCNMSRPWISRGEASASESFQCIANVGIFGAGIEMPLDSMRAALSDRMADGLNKGFLRDDALLAIVILTDEDDGSAPAIHYAAHSDYDNDVAKVDTYVTFLDRLKQDRGRWATAVIAGDRACKSSFGSADEAPRLKSFVAQAGKNGKFSSICNGDLSVSLEDALETFGTACKEFPGVK